jgi:DNA replication protein DnaC
MPTAYGEGQESAQERLQDEIDAARRAPSIIPFSRNRFFVGREAQLAIVGHGGTGKSQLALEIAHRTRKNKKHCSVF